MIIAIIRIPRPPEAQAAATLEARFAERLGFVQGSEGFISFELLRPVEGADHYLSISRWADRAAFNAWTASTYNAQAHGRPAPPAEGTTPTEAPPGMDTDREPEDRHTQKAPPLPGMGRERGDRPAPR